MKPLKGLLIGLFLASTGWCAITSVGTFPAGSNGQIQFNKRNDFGASSDLTYSTTTKTLSAPMASFSTMTINGVTYTFPTDHPLGYYLSPCGGNALCWIPPVSPVSGGESALGVNMNAVSITTPTAAINFVSPFIVTAVGAGTTAQVSLDVSSVTLNGPLSASAPILLNAGIFSLDKTSATLLGADPVLGGALSGTLSNAVLGIVDISAKTNLAANAPVTLTGDVVGIDRSSFTLLGPAIEAAELPSDGYASTYINTSGDTMTGQLTVSGSSITATGTNGIRATYGISGGSLTARNLSNTLVAVDVNGVLISTTVPTGSTGASTMAMSSGSATNSVSVSSPTSNVIVDSHTFILSLQGSTSAYLSVNPSSVTVHGDNVILLQSSPQANAVMNISSGTVNNLITTTATVKGDLTVGDDATITGGLTVNGGSGITADNLSPSSFIWADSSKRIVTVSTAVFDYSSNIASLGTDTGTIKATVDSHTTSIANLGTSTGTIKATVDSHTTSIANLGSSTGSIKSTVDSHTTSIANLGSSTGSIKSTVDTLTSSMSAVMQSTGTLLTTSSATATYQQISSSGSFVQLNPPSQQTGALNVASGTVSDFNASTISVSGLSDQQVLFASGTQITGNPNVTYDPVTGGILMTGSNEQEYPLTIYQPNYTGVFHAGINFSVGTSVEYAGARFGYQAGGAALEDHGFFLIQPLEDKYMYGFGRKGLHIGYNNYGQNGLDVSSGVVVGPNFTSNQIYDHAFGYVGATAPEGGMAVEGAVVIGTYTATGAKFRVQSSTTDVYDAIFGPDLESYHLAIGTNGVVSIPALASVSCISADENGNLQAGTCSGGDSASSTSTVKAGAGLDATIDGSTVTLSLSDGITVSTVSASSATFTNVSADTVTVKSISVGDGTGGDWPVMVPASGVEYRIAGSSTALTVGEMVVALSSNGALGTIAIPSGDVSVVGTPSSGQIAAWKSASSISSATASEVVSLFSDCSGTQYLGADGACHTAAGSGDVVAAGTNTFTGGNALMGSTTFYGPVYFAGKSTQTWVGVEWKIQGSTNIQSPNILSVEKSVTDPTGLHISTYGVVLIDSGTFKSVAVTGSTPTLSACGTSPTITGTNNAFTFTVGTSTGSCNVTFVPAFASTPVCAASPRTPSTVNAMGYVVTSSSISFTRTTFDSQVVDVHCIERK